MKVFAVSDPHLSFTAEKPMSIFGAVWENHWEAIAADWSEKVGADDIVLLPGDISWGMTTDEARKDLETIGAMPGKKIYVKGNHDYWWGSLSKVRGILPEGSYCIQNDALKFGKFIFCGSRGWSVPEIGVKPDPNDEKLLRREQLRLELSLKAAEKLATGDPREIKIGMMHFPPFDSRMSSTPFTDLFAKYGVKKVVYGHLHGQKCRAELRSIKNDVEYYLTSCDITGNKLVFIAE